MISRFLAYLEKINNGKLLLYIVNFFSIWFRINKLQVEDIEKLGVVRARILKAKFRLGYKVNFINVDLISAYKLRLLHFIAISRGLMIGDRNDARHYLEVINNSEFLNYIKLDSNLLAIMKGYDVFQLPSIDVTSDCSMSLGKALLIGPGADTANLDLTDFDSIIFIKPPKVKINLEGKIIVVILNNFWIKNKVESIYSWMQDYPQTSLVSPQDMCEIGITEHKAFKSIRNGPNGASPMGLQRALIILTTSFNFSNLELQGFDFSLSEQPYHESYPSGIKELGVEKDVILWSNLIHDFFYNFYLAKAILKRHKNINGHVREITDSNPAAIARMFEAVYR